MKQIRLVALRADRKAFLECLQRLGAVEIESEQNPPDGFVHLDMETQAEVFDRSAATIQRALDVLQTVVPASKGLLQSLSGRREISREEFSRVNQNSADILKDCQRVLDLQKECVENEAEQLRLRTALDQLIPWEKLDLPLRFRGTRTTAAFIGSVPYMCSLETLGAAIEERGGADLVWAAEIFFSSPEQSCLCLLVPRPQAAAMESILQGMGFAYPSAGAGSLPQQQKEDYLAQLQALKDKRTQLDEEWQPLAGRRQEMEEAADGFRVRADKYRAISRLEHSPHTFLLSGYIPEVDVPQLRQALEPIGPMELEITEADPDRAPVKLRNSRFAAPAESITEMYAMPLASDVDPTSVMSIFFYLFFGMMLSDAGYGLLLTLGSLLLIKKLRPEPRMANNLRLFAYCGVSTMGWGLVFGSFFGDAPAVIAETFFGREFTMPHLLDPVTDAISLLVLSLVLGGVQVITGLAVRLYMQWRSGDRWGALWDTGLWITTLLGVGLLAAGMAFPPVMTVGAVLAVLSLVGLVLTQGRKKKGPMKVISGLASLYDVTGYVSDLMSYSRLMALGLTTGVMGAVFNMLGSMFGKGPIGVLLMALIFIVGHSINLGINALGAYVHTIRLQYVELFSKFYEGGGRPFQPFAFRSQYIRIKEEKRDE